MKNEMMIEVEYASGEGRKLQGAVDYMIANIETAEGDEIELYAETKNPTWNEEKEEYDDECATYESLKDEIIDQAKENGIDVESLSFMYD